MTKKSKASQPEALTKQYLSEIIFPEPALHEFNAESLVPKGPQINGTIARPLNSFLMFRKRYSVQLCEANSQRIGEVQKGPKKLTLLSKLASHKWNLMQKEDGEAYKFFEDAAKRVSEEHARRHPDYVFQPKHRKKAAMEQSDSANSENLRNKTMGAARNPSLSSATAHVSVQSPSTAEAEEQESPCGERVEANECRKEQIDGQLMVQLSDIVAPAGLNEATPAQKGSYDFSHRATDSFFNVFDSTSNSVNEPFASARPGEDMVSHLGQGSGSHTIVFPATGFIQPSIPTAGGFYDRYTLPMPYPYQPHGSFQAYQRGPGPLNFSHYIDPLLHAPANMGNGYDMTYSMGELPMNYTNGMMYASGSTQPPPSLYSPTSYSTYSPVSDSSDERLTPFAAAMHWTNQV
ncbi:hypothetical protein DFH11DRAFT_1544671 [Phellopilus nigrolimitatus]|nr:hypothetical protein DFH11DRAFT_1544671 [Phellopilus nigrolimitatus]